MDWRGKIIDLMKERDISQKELAKMSGVTESSVSRYLKGNQRPRMDILVNFAKALNVKTEYLLDDDEKCESAYSVIATAIARNGNKLTPEEKNELISLIIGAPKHVQKQ